VGWGAGGCGCSAWLCPGGPSGAGRGQPPAPEGRRGGRLGGIAHQLHGGAARGGRRLRRPPGTPLLREGLRRAGGHPSRLFAETGVPLRASPPVLVLLLGCARGPWEREAAGLGAGMQHGLLRVQGGRRASGRPVSGGADEQPVRCLQLGAGSVSPATSVLSVRERPPMGRRYAGPTGQRPFKAAGPQPASLFSCQPLAGGPPVEGLSSAALSSPPSNRDHTTQVASRRQHPLVSLGNSHTFASHSGGLNACSNARFIEQISRKRPEWGVHSRVTRGRRSHRTPTCRGADKGPQPVVVGCWGWRGWPAAGSVPGRHLGASRHQGASGSTPAGGLDPGRRGP
jgi:hypothetical protein